jgi:hypothetical protein
VVTHRPLRDIFSSRASLELAPRAETIDEYRELDMLAHAWEGGSLKPEVADGAPGRAEDPAGKESA